MPVCGPSQWSHLLSVESQQGEVPSSTGPVIEGDRHQTHTCTQTNTWCCKCMFTCSVGQLCTSALSVSVPCHFNQLHNVQLLSDFMCAVVKNLIESVIILVMEKLHGSEYVVSPHERGIN